NPTNPDAKIAGKWVLKGYQADIDFANQFTGMIYEERALALRMQRAQSIEMGADGVSRQIGKLEMNADELKSLIKSGDWNSVHLIARGNTIMNIVNGHVTAFIVDDDPKGRAMKGLLGFQIHVGDPMKIEFRNVYLKGLEAPAARGRGRRKAPQRRPRARASGGGAPRALRKADHSVLI